MIIIAKGIRPETIAQRLKCPNCSCVVDVIEADTKLSETPSTRFLDCPTCGQSIYCKSWRA